MKLGGVLLVGLVLGLVGGLLYTWFVAPVQYYDTYPPMLAARYRQDWVQMVAQSYALEGNWERTQTRLLNIPEEEIRSTAVALLEQAVAAGAPDETLARLAELAAAYGATGPGVTLYADGRAIATAPADAQVPTPLPSPTRPPATSTATPLPTATLIPTPTPVLTQTSPFQIVSQTLTCDPVPFIAVSLELSHTVTVRGRERQELVGLPMRQLWLLWDDGADRAVTGFNPDQGLGYADFDVVPGRTYNLYVDSPYGRPILTVQVEPCTPSDGEGWVSRSLVLLDETQPELDATPTLTGTLEGPALTGTITATLTVTPSSVTSATVTPSTVTPSTVTPTPAATP